MISQTACSQNRKKKRSAMASQNKHPASPLRCRRARVASLLIALLIAALVVCPATDARAEWTYVSLHPAGLQNSSWLYGVADGQQVGGVNPNGPVGVPTAAVWSGTAGSYV